MSAIKRFIQDLLRRTDNLIDDLRHRLRGLTGWGRRVPLTIAAYRGYGRPDYLFLQGRVLKYKLIYGAKHNSFWKSIVDSYRRFGSREIRDAHVEIQLAGHTFEVVTDDEGFFRLSAPIQPPLPPSGLQRWAAANLEVVRTPWSKTVDYAGAADVLLPSPSARFGVISDIDDTILQTHVTSLLKLKTLFYTVFKNAAGRKSFNEVAAFYRALQSGKDQETRNPFFYVSNSPWNLYDLLQDFLALNHLPKGPILLRDFGISRHKHQPPLSGHKYRSIRHLLETYPQLPFLLIGDSGERDADIYLQVARRHPDRILGIYIRDVRSRRRAERIAWLIRNATDVPIQLVHQYAEAAKDAAEKGLLDEEQFEALREKFRKE
mgnify:CR=1 FL=1